MNPLEITDFKVAFCGINGVSNKNYGDYYTLHIKKKILLAVYYAKELCLNPAYLNSSLLDSIFAYFSYYILPHRFISLYDYVPWQENEINKTLIEQYGWETDPTTKTTWRIGDGTASFYNYIYYRIAGFTENDTFRSNQIREGQISREEALKQILMENQPRPQAIKWYFDTIGLPIEEILSTINQIASLYP